MTQNNERELLVKIKYAICMAIYSDDGLDGLEGENLMKEIDKYLSPISQNEQQEAVAYIYRNEYNEYRLEPADNFNIKTIPMNEHILLYKSPPKQAIPEDVIKDAERYNWLKQNYHGFEMFRHSTIPYVTLDREVDKAMLNAAPTNTEVGE